MNDDVVVVTGGLGVLGRAVIEAARAKGARIASVDHSALPADAPEADLHLCGVDLTDPSQAERAMAYWPNRGEADTRPPLGQPYRRLEPVAPKNPVVPVDAPGALRLPIVGVS